MTVACPFCSKLAALDQLPPDEVVWRLPHAVVLLGPWQYYRGYCLVVSRRHAVELSGLADAERRGYVEEMCLVARAIEEGFRPHKLNYELLGNQVPHLHWHLFPRSADDPERLRPVWFTLDRAEHDAAERRRLLGEPAERPATLQVLRDRLTALKAPHA